MRIAIVGAEAAKFSPEMEARACAYIRRCLRHWQATAPPIVVVSGGCHLGGADLWAEAEARALGLTTRIHRPRTHRWSSGYKPRNLLIARDCDVLYNLVVAAYLPSYTGLRFPGCYHCRETSHVKSGGCWTLRQAVLLGRPARRVILPLDPAQPLSIARYPEYSAFADR